MPEPILDAVEQKVGYFLVAGLTQRDRQPFLTTTNLEASINLAPQTACLWAVGVSWGTKRKATQMGRKCNT